MIILNHIINPFKCNEDNKSYLYYAQPITFKSMNISKKKANNIKNLKINLYSINYNEDESIIPDYFNKLPNLKESTKDYFETNRKLPFLQEIFNSIIKNVQGDYIIFTNSDIALKPNFYKKIYKIIKNEKRTSFTINRRDNIPKFIIKNNEKIRMNDNNLKILNSFNGKKHPGNDCFVIHRNLLKYIYMGSLFIGYPPWGKILVDILKKLDPSFKIYKDLHITYHIGKDKSWKKNKNILNKININNSKIIKKLYNI